MACRCRGKAPPTIPVSDSRADAFRFRVDDANGFGCPKGSHIRRVNPRDSLGVDVKSSIKSTKLHRLLRRGRPYLEEIEGKAPRKGIFFIACNADLERQFEFIHQRWVRNSNFGCLQDQDDPVVGRRTFPRSSPFRDWRAARRCHWPPLRKRWVAATSSFRESKRSNSSWNTSRLRKQSWHRPPAYALVPARPSSSVLSWGAALMSKFLRGTINVAMMDAPIRRKHLGAQRDRRHPRIAGLKTATGRMVGAAPAFGRGWIDLADSFGCEM